MTPRPTHATLSAITDLSALIDSTRNLADRARALRMTDTARELRALATDLDGSRTALITDGEAALDDALDALEYAADELTEYAARIGRARGRA
ncbi:MULTISPECIES: hypothetical protein [unclassified Microbacterium]|uniref:hypothetical protein n=1 Tax=unclassified Microbacterium TaxID=2609290 RepID=UPI003017A891